MSDTHFINVDLARVWDKPTGKAELVTTLGWGDLAEVVSAEGEEPVRIKTVHFNEQPDNSIVPIAAEGFIRRPPGLPLDHPLVLPKEQSRVLKVNFVDVQQGDGSVIETPGGKVVLIDGGDNQLFARYLANRFRDTSPEEPRTIDCILVTHGDADHFRGLTRIYQSETEKGISQRKRLFISPQRIYHNGLVKRPGELPNKSDRPEAEMLGPTVKQNGETMITGLVENLLDDIGVEEMNEEFQGWRHALSEYNRRKLSASGQPLMFRRLRKGDDSAFDFLKEEGLEGLNVEVLGPIPEQVTQGNPPKEVDGLPFLGKPPKNLNTEDTAFELEDDRFTGLSASHTINGHSVVFRLTYGKFRFLFAGDLNKQSEHQLTREHNEGKINLTAEVFKVPHHGSDDFSAAFLRAVSPLISVVSSGDENARKEYIHPRANLMGALGRHSRMPAPIVFVTELIAFFQVVGWTTPEFHELDDEGDAILEGAGARVLPEAKQQPKFFGFKRTAFGIVKVRTDGHRLLVYTNSGQKKLKEAYAFTINEMGEPVPKPVLSA